MHYLKVNSDLPAVIGPYVYRRLGSANFRRHAMLNGRMDTDEALRIGMIDAVDERIFPRRQKKSSPLDLAQ